MNMEETRERERELNIFACNMDNQRVSGKRIENKY
jgi:hypothetical protein